MLLNFNNGKSAVT